MRVFGKIMKIILSIVLVLSLVLNVLLILSTSNSLAIKDSADKRLELYNEAYYKIIDSKTFTFVNENVNNDNTRVKDTMTCTLKGDSITSDVSCAKITYLYGEDGKLIRTSYFPGNGYKYYVENENEIKEVFDENLNKLYFRNLIKGALSQISYLIMDVSYPTYQEYINYDNSIRFDFNTFSLVKEITFNYSYNNDNLKMQYEFDGSDRLSKIIMSENSILEISYEAKSLQFPAFDGFAAA